MKNLNNTRTRDFYQKLWNSPYRRWWRYSRRLLLSFFTSMAVWGGLNAGIAVLKFPDAFSLLTLACHTTLAVGTGCCLAVLTYYLQLRQLSRFRLARVFKTVS